MIIQANQFDDLTAVTVLPLTSTLIDTPLLRVPIAPTPRNGLATLSHAMIDKVQSPLRQRLGSVIGSLDDAGMLAINRALAVFLGLA